MAGPIVTHDVLIPQLKDKRRKCIDFSYLSKGFALFTFGLAKKVLIADVFGNFVNLAYSNIETLNTTSAFFSMLGYTFQIYFDFSGYSDMAIGLGWMMNIDLPINFDSPYKAVTVTEFWKKWHITLTTFFTKYVYIPLGGSRKGIVKTFANIFIVFWLSGLWHGAGWTFIFWGSMHGLMQILEKGLEKYWAKFHPAFSWLITFGFINVSWIFFRAGSISDANTILFKIISFDFGAIDIELVNTFSQPEWYALCLKFAPKLLSTIYVHIVMGLYFVVAIIIVLVAPSAKQMSEKVVNKQWTSIMLAFLLVWCVFSFSGISTFLYFNF